VAAAIGSSFHGAAWRRTGRRASEITAMPHSLAETVAITCLLVVLVAAPPAARSRAVRHGPEPDAVEDAIHRIHESVDPCGETGAVRAVLRRLERCGYEVRTSTTAEQNLFDRRTITWNPDLRSQLEPACDDDPATPVLRDPTASLLHELVHAADDCEGLNPGEHELDAVRIENIYPRAAGLCQRTRYGDAPLPASTTRSCADPTGTGGCPG